ncbi:hypothetical protein KVR01_013468 [Diaporthe batatas]|uniref:uncharacterized protein n=1 Tax=Diaporthe batatas TaxID=748121 RepID=UPI001D042ED1|nr:uncharacterized protein KVR01_013468 [Diaporthe batatas]KAG8156677.1 hypothetical protein KVR01_013468 [Diaporthe batatas]
MSSLITPGQPATRCFFSLSSRCTASYAVSTQPAHSPLPRTGNRPTQRHFAQKFRITRPAARPAARPAPSLSASPRLSAKGDEPPRWIFSPADVPPIKDWTASIEGLGAKHMTPLQCMEAAQRYVSAATQRESSWRPRLEKDFDLPVFLLHWVAILLIADTSASRWKLGTHMLRSASELGYNPSTLTLTRILTSMPPAMQKKAAASKMFIDANSRFQKLLQNDTDPNALTLQGRTFAKKGTQAHDRQALDSFRRAEKAWEAKAKSSAPSQASERPSFDIKKGSDPDYVSLPEPREPRWEWEVTWALEQARILEKQKRTDEARDMYRVAALELDNPQGFWNLSRLMEGPRDSPERRTYLLKAAITGEQEACREMGVLEKMAAERQDLADRDRADRELLSREWFRLADGEDLESIKDDDED